MPLDPDLWNDDGTAKKPSQEYMESLAKVTPFADLAAEGEFIQFQAANKAAGIGDLVHFFDGEVCRAAIVMEVEGHTCTLRVHIPHQSFEDWEADHDEKRELGGTWHWTWGECP